MTCKPASPGKTGCYFLDAIFQVASVGDSTYTVGIWPTATDAQVQQLRSILQRSPYVSNFRIKDR